MIVFGIDIIAVMICLFVWWKRRRISDIYVIVAVAALLATVYSILTYGRTVIHSDVATANILFESVVRNKSLFPSTFNYANGDIWFLTLHLFCGIPSLFTNDQSLIRMLASSQLLLIAMAGVLFLSKKLFKDNSWAIAMPIILLCIRGERSMLIYEAGYISLVLWLTLIPTLFYIACKSGIKTKVIYLLLFSCVVTASPVRYAAELILPLLLAICMQLYLEYNEAGTQFEKKRVTDLVRKILLLFVPAILGTVIYYWICSWHNVNNTSNNSTVFVDSIQTIWNNIFNAMFDVYSCFGYIGGVSLVSLNGIINLITISIGTLTCIVVPFLQLRRVHQEEESAQYYILFALIHNFVIATVCILFGQVAIPRYMLTFVIVSIIISARYIYTYWIDDRLNGKILTLAFCTCMIIESSILGYNSIGWRENLNQQRGVSDFLKNNGLEKGYATYWNAYNNEVYSDMEIEFGAVNLVSGGISPFYWLVDSDVYEDDGKETFLMLTTAEKESLDFNIISTFGMPIEELNYGDYNILVFDHDISVNMIH